MTASRRANWLAPPAGCPAPGPTPPALTLPLEVRRSARLGMPRGPPGRPAPPDPDYAAGVAQPDVIVVGLGSMGAAAAYHLARRGVAVLGWTASCHRTGGARTPAGPHHPHGLPGGADYVPLVRRAYALWTELEDATGERLLTTTGGLMLGRPRLGGLRWRREAARVHGLAHELLDAGQVRARFSQLHAGRDEVGLYEEVAGLVRPEAAIRGPPAPRAGGGSHPADRRRRGGRESTPGGVRVSTADGGEMVADRLVLTPGAWARRRTGWRSRSRVRGGGSSTTGDRRVPWPTSAGPVPGLDLGVRPGPGRLRAAGDGRRGQGVAAPRWPGGARRAVRGRPDRPGGRPGRRLRP